VSPKSEITSAIFMPTPPCNKGVRLPMFVTGTVDVNPIVAKTFSKIFFVSFNSGGRNAFYRWPLPPPLVTFAPHPNPPPRRGEGRVGVMLLEIFMQRLGKDTVQRYRCRVSDSCREEEFR
jgi:hypothetical protein